jgi:hypothetical protein
MMKSAVRLLGGEHHGEIAFIPRIALTPTIQGMHFHSQG